MGVPERDPEIRVILDQSALASYVRGHVHVGELIHELADERSAYFGVPDTVLLQAHAAAQGSVEASASLDFMVTLPNAMLLPLGREGAMKAARYMALVDGDLPRAHAIWAARKHQALCFTAEPEVFPSAILPEQIVAIPKEDG